MIINVPVVSWLMERKLAQFAVCVNWRYYNTCAIYYNSGRVDHKDSRQAAVKLYSCIVQQLNDGTDYFRSSDAHPQI